MLVSVTREDTEVVGSKVAKARETASEFLCRPRLERDSGQHLPHSVSVTPLVTADHNCISPSETVGELVAM